ncbi:MAG: hypothetical protein HY755_06215 [Nitrospirae bacterium]|nr:hypothetical protein [Nitrospirota bacterium]
MLNCMMHEPFYASGKYVNEHLGLYAGWTTLEGSFSDCMPVYNEKKDLILLFSGENFVDKEVVDQLKSQGHECGNSTEARYLIHLYEELGEERFLQQLNGWFSGLLVDLRQNKTILFNDRYGMGRIYYYEGKDAFYFSSEAKALLKVCPELREIDLKGLGEFFTCGAVLENRTLFPKIFLLPGGSKWTFNNSSIKKDFYFRPSEWENQPILDKETFYKKFKETFLHILPRYFDAKQPIGMSLTGGLDTRMIMACMNLHPWTLPCYTYGGMYRDCYDVKIARKVAQLCQQTHQVLRLDENFLSDFSENAEKTIYITDGCTDVSVSHEAYLNRLARSIAPVRITGNYGSEVIRSINYLRADILPVGLLQPDFENLTKEAEQIFTKANTGHQLSYAVFRLVPWHLYGRLIAGQSQVTTRTPYMDNDLVGLMYQAPEEIRRSKEPSFRLIADSNQALSGIMTDRGVGWKSNYFFSKLARLFRETSFKAEYFYNHGTPDWLARLDYRFRKLHPEKLFLGRHKIEHYRIWFRDNLFDYIQSILLDEKSLKRPYVNRHFLEKIVQGHVNGQGNFTREINRMLTAELIQRLLIENI